MLECSHEFTSFLSVVAPML